MIGLPLKVEYIQALVKKQEIPTIDMQMTNLSPAHCWNYLSYLKIDNDVVNLNADQLSTYMTTKDLVDVRGVIEIVQQVLWFAKTGTHNECTIWTTSKVEEFVSANVTLVSSWLHFLKSLPLFLAVAAGTVRDGEFNHESFVPGVGVNVCNLFKDDMFLFELLSDTIFSQDIREQTYYTDSFDKYIYGGWNLVWFVNKNPNNVLFGALR